MKVSKTIIGYKGAIERRDLDTDNALWLIFKIGNEEIHARHNQENDYLEIRSRDGRLSIVFESTNVMKVSSIPLFEVDDNGL